MGLFWVLEVMPAVIESWPCLAPAICHWRQAQAGGFRGYMLPKRLASMALTWPQLFPKVHGKKWSQALTVLQGLSRTSCTEARNYRSRNATGQAVSVSLRPDEKDFQVLWAQAALRKPKWRCAQISTAPYKIHNSRIISPTNFMPTYNFMKALSVY